MKIPFSNLGQQPKHVIVTLEKEGFSMTLEADLRKSSLESVILEGELKGMIELECDACADSFEQRIDEKVTLRLTDRPYHTEHTDGDEQDYDIIEFLDGIIDLNEIIESEVNTIKYDYHKCTNCN